MDKVIFRVQIVGRDDLEPIEVESNGNITKEQWALFKASFKPLMEQLNKLNVQVD